MTTETSGIEGVLGFEVEDGVALLTLNRPESLNALNSELQRAIGDAFVRIRNDDAIRVAVIRGSGRAFCAGVDLKERAAREAQGDARPGEFFSTSVPPSYVTFDAKKPLIAAIHGHCLAGGLELALACDLRVASDVARFGLPEIQRGFFPGGGGPQRLMRQLPHAVALDLLLTGEPMDAESALRVGIVSRLFAEDELLPRTMEMARRIAGYAPLAVRSLREISYASTDIPLERSLRFGNSLRWIIGQTEDAKEGPRAFSEKREPQYRGE